MRHSRFLFFLVFSFLLTECSSLGNFGTSETSKLPVWIREEGPYPVYRLVPVRPASFSQDATPGSDGCFSYENPKAVNSSRLRMDPPYLIKIGRNFLKKEYGSRADLLPFGSIQRYKSEDSIQFVQDPSDGANFANKESVLKIGESEVISGNLCVFDIYPENSSAYYCHWDKAVEIWTKTMQARKVKLKKQKLNMLIRYNSIDKPGQILMAPYWWLYESDNEKSDLLINQHTCEIREGL
ncbi:hypothetical protein [Leptospira wolffii]|uniref:hypothetical protein n=1 Tax=Leptospira wolffii TaxID=409998 RepID=UPI000352BB84|nr:hypothetical protein [Leptospira wolffii]EPG66191.1 hypothetical protein LEP1GSC061_4125 [Leptospira wolffii serovar Khorat str. Khorat-H2]